MKALYLLGLVAFASSPAHADVLAARLKAFDAVIPCAAQLTGLRNTQVDVSLPTGEFFGGNPAMYERCVAPRLRDAGLKAPKFSLMEFASKWQAEELGGFINEIAVRSQR